MVSAKYIGSFHKCLAVAVNQYNVLLNCDSLWSSAQNIGRRWGTAGQEVWGPVLPFGNIYFKASVTIQCSEAKQDSHITLKFLKIELQGMWLYHLIEATAHALLAASILGDDWVGSLSRWCMMWFSSFLRSSGFEVTLAFPLASSRVSAPLSINCYACVLQVNSCLFISYKD